MNCAGCSSLHAAVDDHLLGIVDEFVDGRLLEERHRVARRLFGVADVDVGFDAKFLGRGRSCGEGGGECGEQRRRRERGGLP